MSAALGQRLAALAAAALLAGVFSVALSQAGRGTGGPDVLPPAAGARGGWSTTFAGVANIAPSAGRPSGCPWIVNRRTLGVIHPVLPCGARIFIEYGSTRALTRVVAHAPVPRDHDLDLTPALAGRLGLTGLREIRWAYAR